VSFVQIACSILLSARWSRITFVLWSWFSYS